MKNAMLMVVWTGNYGIIEEFSSRGEALEHANELNKALGNTVAHAYVVMTEAERAAKEVEQSTLEREFYRSLSKAECDRYGIG